MALAPTERTCASCGDHLWSAPAGDLELLGCPSCDRPRCSACGHHFGFLFAPYVRRYALMSQGDRCDLCIDEAA